MKTNFFKRFLFQGGTMRTSSPYLIAVTAPQKVARRCPHRAALFGMVLLLSAFVLGAAEEQDLINTLKSSAAAPEKCAACLQLKIVGTSKSVPALAALLTEEVTSHAARNALETLPFPQAVAALREALPHTTGLIKVGLIDSLGKRQDTASVPLLIPLLSEKDNAIATAAATSLGRIGTEKAVTALVAIRSKAPAELQPAVWSSLLHAAQARLAAGENKAALTVFRDLYSPKSPDHIRIAAWRGIVLADTKQRPKIVNEALTGPDAKLQNAALKIIREVNDPAVVKACAAHWQTLSEPTQLAVLDTKIKLGKDVLPALRTAFQSPHSTVRLAAWQAIGDFGDASDIAALAHTAAQGQPAERDAARESLARLHGPGIREGLLARIENSQPEEQAILLRALGDRDDTAASQVLLKNASSPTQPVRLAALHSLEVLAIPDTAIPLIRLAGQSRSDSEAQPVLSTLSTICQSTPDKEQLSRAWLDAIHQLPPAQQTLVLPILSDLGTPAALEAALSAAHDSDPDHAKAAISALSQWPNATPSPQLLQLATDSKNETIQTLALRGAISVSAQETDSKARLQLLEKAFSAATRPEEKRQALGQMGEIPTPEALDAVMAHLGEAGVSDEAAFAALNIAEKLSSKNPKLANEVGNKILEQSKHPEAVRRAEALCGKLAGNGPFINAWVVCGPYRQGGAEGADALFKIAFAPEKSGEKAEWKTLPREDLVDLAKLFPGEMNCAAYLKTRIISPRETNAKLLLGSDDGVKAWFNGEVVHSNNTDRGLQVDQDSARIHLKQGTNELMLKITQGGGGWGAIARVVAPNGQPIKGLRAEAGEAPATHAENSAEHAVAK